MLSLIAVSLLASSPIVRAAIGVNYPGGPNVSFTAGGSCNFSYTIDPTKTWTNMAVDLMSGANLEMVNVTRVAQGIDATIGNGSYQYTCPNVSPNSDIYFLQFANSDNPTEDKLWTSRFTIAAANGSSVPPSMSAQPGGEPTPWGVGTVISGETGATPTSSTSGVSGSASSTITSAPTSTATSAPVVFSGTCGATNACPESVPCCSEWGNCGTGRSCLAGCNPLGSFGPGACAPIAVCQDTNVTFHDATRLLQDGAAWNGDASTADFIFDLIGDNKTDVVAEEQLVLTLTQDNGGTRVSSTRSILYGNVTARMQVPSENGVVTSLSLISGAGDEIIWELTTNNDSAAQTAYFYLGDVANYTTLTNVTVSNRTAFHDYGINWCADQIDWTFDGVVVRSVTKQSTLDAAKPGSYHYPTTPARVQISVWAAGVSTEAPGTIAWSGGLVDWSSTNYTAASHYAAYVDSVAIACSNVSTLEYVPSNGTVSPVGWNSTNSTTSTSTGWGAPWVASSTSSSIPGWQAPSSSSTPGWQASSSSSSSSASGWNAPSSVNTSDVSASATSTSSGSSSALSSSSTPPWWKAQATTSFSSSVSSSSSSSSSSSASSASVLPFARRNSGLNLFRRDVTSPNATSYVCSGQDSFGQLAYLGSNASTVIFSSDATGFNMNAGLDPSTDPNSAASALGGTLSNPGSFPTSDIATPTTIGAASLTPSLLSSSSNSNSPSASPSTVAQEWDSLSTAAHAGVYIGGAAGALLIVVGIGFLWNKASASRSGAGGPNGPEAGGAYGAYHPVEDEGEGEMVASGPLYHGSGEMYPGEDLYAGGQVPGNWGTTAGRAGGSRGGYDEEKGPLQFPEPPTAPQSGRGGGGGAPKFQMGGYVPSAQRQQQMSQYAPGYVPQDGSRVG